MVNATPRPLYPRKRRGTHCVRSTVSHRAGIDGCRKSRPNRDSIPGPTKLSRALQKLLNTRKPFLNSIQRVHPPPGNKQINKQNLPTLLLLTVVSKGTEWTSKRPFLDSRRNVLILHFVTNAVKHDQTGKLTEIFRTDRQTDRQTVPTGQLHAHFFTSWHRSCNVICTALVSVASSDPAGVICSTALYHLRKLQQLHFRRPEEPRCHVILSHLHSTLQLLAGLCDNQTAALIANRTLNQALNVLATCYA